MAEYKIVASDLDGTFLNSKGEISCENLKAVSELAKRGVYFVPSSGRSYAEIPEKLRNHHDIRYYIHSSGAVVYDKLTGERISFCFPVSLSSQILKFVFEHECHVTIRRMGKMYTGKEFMSEERFEKNGVWKTHRDLLCNVAEAIDGFKETFVTADEVEMISIFIKDDLKYAELKARLAEFPDVNVASACAHNIEITYAKAGKANALSALAEKLGYTLENTVAVGDSENDVSMVRAAGLGLAMKNATEELKANADEIICSNDEHSAEYVLKKYVM